MSGRDSIQTLTATTGNDQSETRVTGTESGDKRLLDTNNLAGLSLPPWDYMALVIASAVETYTFRTGGSGGTIVAVVVITYVNASRADILNVERTT